MSEFSRRLELSLAGVSQSAKHGEKQRMPKAFAWLIYKTDIGAIGKFIINIRIENQGDILQVRTLNEQAFEQPVEANIVDKLRQAYPDFLSFVAEGGKIIVGHILFTPIHFGNHKTGNSRENHPQSIS